MSLDVTAGGAFVAGLLSFASPCLSRLVPPYLPYIGSVFIEQWRDAGGAKTRACVVLAALCFVAGNISNCDLGLDDDRSIGDCNQIRPLQ